MRASSLVFFYGGCLVLLGLIVIIGWLGHEPALIELVPGFHGMPYSTAAGFVLAGLALVAAGLDGPAQQAPAGGRPRALPPLKLALPAVLLIVLGAAGLADWQTNFGLGLSPPKAAVRAWFADSNPYSGRMRPLAAAAFIALGVVFLLPRQAPRAAVPAQGLTLLVLFIGFLGVIGQLAGFDKLFVWYLGPVFAAGVGFLVASLGLFALRPDLAAGPGGHGHGDGDRVGLMAGAVIVVTGLGGIFGGFAVLYPQAVSGLENNLALSLKSRDRILEDTIVQGWTDTQSFGNQPLRLEAMRRLNLNPRDAAQQARLQAVADRHRAFGFSAVRFHDAEGREVARAGAFAEAPELAVAVRTPTPAALLWQGGYRLQARVDMIQDGVRVGSLEAERALAIGEDLHDTTHFGASLDFAVCAAADGHLDCFPFRSTGARVLRNVTATLDGQPLPMAHALAGKTGIVHSHDYRGVPVIAAYAPLGSLGLGTVLKVDADELYQPIAGRLRPLLLMLLVVGAASIVLLRLQVMPLVRSMTREIDERKKAEARLQDSEARLAEITGTLGEGVYVFDENGIVTFVNPEAERLLGRSAAELVGCDGHATFHFRRPDGTPLPADQCPLHQAVLTGQTFRSLNEWFVRKDGSFLPIAIVSRPIVRDGRIVGSVASFNDTSARLAAEAALRESEERFRLISTAATDGIVIIGPEGEVIYWNPAAEKIFGYRAEEIHGRQFHDLIAPARLRPDFYRGFHRFRATGEGPLIGKTIEVSALRRDGEEFPVELSISTLRLKDAWHALGLVRDISERKKTEEQIRHLAYYDFLTDLPNRRLFIDRLHQALAQATRHRRALAVLYLDLDRFKAINDSLGHDIGDALLVAVAARLRDCVRGSDTVARLGGDEFAMVLAEVNRPEDAAVVAEKVIQSFRAPVHVKGHRLTISTSIGIALYPVDGSEDAQELIKKADMALYDAKAAGRNRYVFASSPATA